VHPLRSVYTNRHSVCVLTELNRKKVRYIRVFLTVRTIVGIPHRLVSFMPNCVKKQSQSFNVCDMGNPKTMENFQN